MYVAEARATRASSSQRSSLTRMEGTWGGGGREAEEEGEGGGEGDGAREQFLDVYLIFILFDFFF